MIKRLGLFGFPLTHSFSQKYFTEKFQREGIEDFVYENFECADAARLRQIVGEQEDLIGLNVTIPHKQAALALMDELDEEAKQTGAINCIKISRNNGDAKLHGYNTDAFAFEEVLRPLLQLRHHRALILGTGGASKAVAYALRKLGIKYSFVSRNPSSSHYTYADLNADMMKAFQIIVNCTPLGTFPDINSFPPIPYEALSDENLLFDLVYNPAETQFMQKGKAKGAMVQNGLGMLKLQAEKSWEIWNRK